MYNYMNEKKFIYEDRTNKNVVGKLTFNSKENCRTNKYVAGPVKLGWFMIYLFI